MNIWFVPSNGSHVGKFRPLVEALAEEGHDIHFLCVDTSQGAYNAALPQITDGGYECTILPECGLQDWTKHWFWQFRHRGRLVRDLHEALGGRDIDVMVFGSDTGVARGTYIEVANKLGISTVLLSDGLDARANPNYKLTLAQKLSKRLHRFVARLLGVPGQFGRCGGGADINLVLNHIGVEVARGHGAPAHKLRAVGSPEYDELARRIREGTLDIDPREVRERFGLPHDKPVVTYGHQPLHLGQDREEKVIRTLLEGTRRADACLLVKFHPRSRQDPDRWRQWADTNGYNPTEVAFAIKECTSIEAVTAASVLVTPFSTLSLEAMILGRPVVLINYLPTWVLLEYGSKYDAALEAWSPEELADQILISVRDDERRQSLLENARTALQAELFGLDGRSVERIVT